MGLQAVEIEASGEIKQGTLVDASGKHVVPILNFIPRFATSGHYADSFGDQWNRYRSVQIDREMKNGVSEEYLYHWTGWKKQELKNLRILEAGSDAGRFTQIMLDAGAEVYSFDLGSSGGFLLDDEWSAPQFVSLSSRHF
jgi:predicted rRNA methylase YqxC with S4 and FtsJ domains